MKWKFEWLCVGFLVAWSWCWAQSDNALMYVDGQPVGMSEYWYFCSRYADADLERFVDFKLKALAARKVSLDTVGNVRLVLRTHRGQLLRERLLDGVRGDSLAGECYRSLRERKYMDRVRISQIFKYIPQNVSVRALGCIEARMDSLYRVLQEERMMFDDCVGRFSEDKRPMWMVPLQMPVEFEDAVFPMSVGDISRPFFTPQGIHIVKVLERDSLPSFQTIRDRLVERSFNHSSSFLLVPSLDSLKQRYGYAPDKSSMEELLRTGKTDKTLFLLGGRTYTGSDFALFVRSYPASLRRQLEAFVAKSVWEYTYARLDAKDSGLSDDLRFFADSLLGDALVRAEVDSRVEGDTVGVAEYFKLHARQYHWPEVRYDGMVLHCRTKRVARRARKFLKKLPPDEWQEAVRLGINGETCEVVAERGLFAPGDNAFVDSRIFKSGKPEPLADYPYLVLLGRKLKGPERWEDVGGQVWIDYRASREETWRHQLRRHFKVEINEEVLKTVNSHGCKRLNHYLRTSNIEKGERGSS